MIFIKSSAEKELEKILYEMKQYLQNNYKEPAHRQRELLGKRVEELYLQKKISEKVYSKYSRIYIEYTIMLKDYHH